MTLEQVTTEITTLGVPLGADPVQTLRDRRLAGQLTRERLAHRIGMEIHRYAGTETDQCWNDDRREPLALADALGMTPEHLWETIGQVAELIRLLAQAVEGRWRSQVAPLAKLAEVDEQRTQRALRVLRREYTQITERYMGHVVAGSAEARLRELADERVRWLRRLPEHFRELVGHAEERPPTPAASRTSGGCATSPRRKPVARIKPASL
ncbi:transcriptional regulator [Streptomyces sp. HUAS MG47]|uniref:transcriptional regulator n=1 Tax=Streptomyces solicamelliae TaxID=3231716 RepID=UPI003878331C